MKSKQVVLLSKNLIPIGWGVTLLTALYAIWLQVIHATLSLRIMSGLFLGMAIAVLVIGYLVRREVLEDEKKDRSEDVHHVPKGDISEYTYGDPDVMAIMEFFEITTDEYLTRFYAAYSLEEYHRIRKLPPYPARRRELVNKLRSVGIISPAQYKAKTATDADLATYRSWVEEYKE